MATVAISPEGRECRIEERGNGLPSRGSYVPGDDGNLYLLLGYSGPIHTGDRPGDGNYSYAQVALADWDDCAADQVYPCCAIFLEGAV